MALPSWVGPAVSSATCNTLLAAGGQLVGTGVATIWAGGSGVVPLTLGALSFLGAGAVCQNTPVDVADPYPQVDGCQRASSGGYGVLQWKENSSKDWVDFSQQSNFTDVTEIIKTETMGPGQDGRWFAYVAWKRLGGGGSDTTDARYDTPNEADGAKWRIRIVDGTCAATGGDPKPYPDNFHDTTQYTDPTTNCVYNITPQGFVQETDGGGVGMVFKIEAAGPQLRAGGGIVGGCNFEPTLVYQPPGDRPPYTAPWNPTWPDWDGTGTPPWIDLINDIVGGVVSNIISNLITSLFETPYPAGSRTIRAACEYKENGDPETYTVNYPEQVYQDRVLTALNAITDFQQQILLWKTPTCSGGGSSVTGDAVSINWVSDEYTPSGGNRLRKLLTYFDQVGSTLEQTVAHWKDFTWNAGPVIVSVNGVPLGKPQVWADSVDEGKRVINHAAAIAGVDMTKAEWLITSPRASRYGISGLMRVHRSDKGVLGITKRDGPSGLPTGIA